MRPFYGRAAAAAANAVQEELGGGTDRGAAEKKGQEKRLEFFAPSLFLSLSLSLSLSQLPILSLCVCSGERNLCSSYYYHKTPAPPLWSLEMAQGERERERERDQLNNESSALPRGQEICGKDT